MKIIEPLRIPEFRRLYAAQVIANFGDGLDFLAIVTIVVFEWHRGSGALGILALCGAIPLVVGVPLFGLAADRFEPRVVMSLANVARGTSIVGLVFAQQFFWVCVCAGAAAFFGGFFRSAEQRFIRYRVPKEVLLRANSLRSTTERMLTGLAGPSIAALTIAFVGARSTLTITAVCFFVAGLAVYVVGRIPQQPGERKQAQEKTSWRSQFSEGIAYVRTNPPLRLTMLGVGIAYMFAMMYDIMIPVWYREMGGGPVFTGLAMSSMGVGGLLGAVWLARSGDRFNLLSLMAAASAAIGILIGAMGMAGLADLRYLLVIWLVFALVIGASQSIAVVGFSTLVQRLTPPELMGRVGALAGTAMTIPTVVAPALAPGIAALLGVNGLFTACGVALISVGVVIGVRCRAYSSQVAAPEPESSPVPGN